jgi:hypothetical protein
MSAAVGDYPVDVQLDGAAKFWMLESKTSLVRE